MTAANPASFSLPDSLPDITYADITAAAERLNGVAHRTPVLTSRTLNRQTGGKIFFKCENFQRMGAFKFRGAYNALSRLDDELRSQGVLTVSSGNHAQAVALSGQLLGIQTTILMPSDAPAVKREATAGYGAEIIPYDRTTTNREQLAYQVLAERNLTFIHPYDHPHVIAGQGTVAKELLEEVGELDQLLVCCGGGGLLSGSAIATRTLSPSCQIIGVEPAAADDATRSFQTQTLQTVDNPDTICDGARTPYLGKLTFPFVLHYVNDMITVTDAEVLQTMRYLWERLKIVVEPTGCLAAAAVFAQKIPTAGQRIGVVISGGNVDLQQASQWFTAL